MIQRFRKWLPLFGNDIFLGKSLPNLCLGFLYRLAPRVVYSEITSSCFGEAGSGCVIRSARAAQLVLLSSGCSARSLGLYGAMAQKKKKRAKKVKKPDPPGSTLFTEDSLRDLRAQFDFSEGVTLRLPTPSERADSPPEGFLLCTRDFLLLLSLFPIPRPIVKPSPERIPDDFFNTHEELAARKCHWLKHFTRERVERGLKLLHGVPCPSSSTSSDQRANFFVEMQGAKMTLREKKAAEKKTVEDKKALEAIFKPQTPPEVTDEAEGNVVDRVPEVKNTSVVVGLPAGEQAKLKGKRTRGEHFGDKKKRSKRNCNDSRPIFKDKVASANLIASCAWPLLSALENLVDTEKYGETSANFLKAFSSMNTMVHSYDSAACKCEAAKERFEIARIEAESKQQTASFSAVVRIQTDMLSQQLVPIQTHQRSAPLEDSGRRVVKPGLESDFWTQLEQMAKIYAQEQRKILLHLEVQQSSEALDKRPVVHPVW
ncbi:hypothetical protein ISN45_Aa03g035200 [Arabidopsis thaliana x Arabidopsis arenosa]|uniref:Uncharacterized protein n=2 Tax=Arabidopsis TaxID=3701 RepID=A0A8T2AYH0_9BRAS|nr:hypothetical protein ISN45_Aa03g035200 [Arabidopsis thaliana x Arabidopsis arenosa]